MPQDIKVWEITEGEQLKEIEKSRLDLEERLEKWLEDDISILSNDLLVIGRQIKTDYGGFIDILCLDYNGDIVIIELKKEKTPREVTAQTLDYATWVTDLSNEKIYEIANRYFNKGTDLDTEFENKFGDKIPEILNEHHKMLVVGSEIDNSSERIINYLSDEYGIGINASTFQYFKDENEKEYLSRVFLIEPDEAEHRTQTKSYSKRKPPLSLDQLQEIADKKSIGEIHKKVTDELRYIFNSSLTSRSGISFIGLMGNRKSRNSIFVTNLLESDSNKGLMFRIYIDRFSEYFDIEKDTIIKILPSFEKSGYYDDQKEYGIGYFKKIKEVEDFINMLKSYKK